MCKTMLLALSLTSTLPMVKSYGMTASSAVSAANASESCTGATTPVRASTADRATAADFPAIPRLSEFDFMLILLQYLTRISCLILTNYNRFAKKLPDFYLLPRLTSVRNGLPRALSRFSKNTSPPLRGPFRTALRKARRFARRNGPLEGNGACSKQRHPVNRRETVIHLNCYTKIT